MRFEVNRATFLDVLSKVAPVTDFRTTLPVLNYLKCEIQDGQVKFTSTSLEVEAVAKCVTTNTDAGTVLIKGKQLLSLVKQLPEGMIQANVHDNGRVELSMDAGKWMVPGLNDIDDFPAVADVDVAPAVQYDNWSFWWAVDKVINAVDKSEQSYRHLDCVLLEDTPDGAVLMATNGHRLALCPLSNPLGLPHENILMPASSLLYVKGALAETTGQLGITCNENLLTFITENGSASIRTIDASPVPYRQVTAQDPPESLEVNKDALTSAIKRASLFTDKPIALVFGEDGKFSVVVHDRENGASEEFVECLRPPTVPAEVLVNYAYCLDALATIDTDTVIIEYSGGKAPVWFVPAGRAGYFTVVMAMEAV